MRGFQLLGLPALSVGVVLLLTGCASQPTTTQRPPEPGGAVTTSTTDSNGDAAHALVEVRGELVDIKGDLAEQGVYGCCIMPGCNFCPLAAEKCPCAENLTQGMGVCGECKAGWHAGHGNIEGKTAEDVQIAPDDMMQMMYDMKRQKEQEGAAHSH